jgi:hypothetical protein
MSDLYPYGTDFEPPAPVLRVTIAHSRRRHLRRTVLALLDTGSDVTAIPDFLIDELQLEPVGWLRVENLAGVGRRQYTYPIRLQLAELTIPRLEILDSQLDFVVVGRDVLNRFALHLNDPDQTFTVVSDQ